MSPTKKNKKNCTRLATRYLVLTHQWVFSKKEPWGSSALATALKKTMYSTRKWLKGASESLEASETENVQMAGPPESFNEWGWDVLNLYPSSGWGDDTKTPLQGLPGTDLTKPLAN